MIRIHRIRTLMLCFTAAAFWLLPSLAPLWAQTTENQGMTCQTPEFSFAWDGSRNATLIAKADPAQTFEVKLSYLRTAPARKPFQAILVPLARECCLVQGADGSCASPCVTFDVRATPEGSETAVVLDRRALLLSGGELGFHWEALKADKDTKICPARRTGSDTKIRVMHKHDLNIDLGQVYALESGGSWDANAEVALTSNSRWYTWLSSGFSARYSAIGATDESDDSMEDMDTMEEGDDEGGMMGDEADDMGEGDGEETPFNPFEQGGGVLEAEFYVAVNPPKIPNWALVLAGGFGSVPTPGSSDLETRQRTFLGLRSSVMGFNAGRPADSLANSKGFFQIGVGWDDLWEEVILEPASEDGTIPALVSDESERYVLEGQLELPRVGTEWLRIAVRLYASIPTSGDGPSDLRVSALASVDPRGWFDGIGRAN